MVVPKREDQIEIAVLIDADESETLSSHLSPFTASLRIKGFQDPAHESRFIRSIEGLVRKSIEYRIWKSYIVDILGVSSCDLTQEIKDEVTVEIHHHVPTLYELIEAFLLRTMSKGEEFCSFDIATKVMEYHFQNKIGYVSIVSTLHEKYHNGFLQIPMSIVHGNWQAFIRDFSHYLDEDTLKHIAERTLIVSSDLKWSKDLYSGLLRD